MKVELGFLVPENSSEFSAVIKFKDIDHSDAVHLMSRSKKPLTDVGASLEVNSPLAALEIMLMYFSSVSGGDQNQALQDIRENVYPAAANNISESLRP